MQKRTALLFVPMLVAGLFVAASSPATASLPTGTTPVTVTSGNSVLDRDGHLALAGGVSGTVTLAAGGDGVPASVELWTDGKLVAVGQSGPTGAYEVDGLLPATYAICVRGDAVFMSTATGFLGSCHGGAAYNGSKPPNSAYILPVGAGELVTNNDIALAKAAGISGKLTAPNGTGIAGAKVVAHNRSTGKNFDTDTGLAGAYTFSGLTPSATGYTVCFNPFTLGSGTGFLPRCYLNVAWSGSGFPSGTQAVSVTLGNVHSGINQKLARGGAISGTVHKGSGAPLVHVGVIVFAPGGKRLASTATDSLGRYVVRGLAGATGDRVCVAPFDASTAIRYLGKCWKATSWSGVSLPAGTDPVGVNIGATHSGINFTVGRTVYQLGSISGTIQTASDGPLQAADVYLFSDSGAQLGQTTSDVDGNYSFSNLRPSADGYVVCVSTRFADPTPSSATGWESRCYNNTLWNGPGFAVPAAAIRLPLSANQEPNNIDITLNPGGGIEGYVYSGDTTDFPLTEQITAYAYTPGGHQVISTLTNPETGGYELEGLNPGNYIVCFDGRSATSGGTTPGFQAQCFDKIAWDGNA